MEMASLEADTIERELMVCESRGERGELVVEVMKVGWMRWVALEQLGS